MNVVDFGDPHHSKALRDNIRAHPQTMMGISEHLSDAQMVHLVSHIMDCKANRFERTDLCIVVVCKRGRHRSIGMGRMLGHCIKTQEARWEYVELVVEIEQGQG